MKHGGNIRQAEAIYGHAFGTMLDLSTGICPRAWPLPLSKGLPDGGVLDTDTLRDLPQEEDEKALIDAFYKNTSVHGDAAVAIAPGSQILINLVPLLASKDGGDARQGASVAIPNPAYGEHEQAWQHQGFVVQHYEAGKLPIACRDKSICQNLVIVQPGNPLGEVLDIDKVLDSVSTITRESGGLVVVDEAFADLMDEASLLPYAGRKGLIVLRSFGKFYGLAGIRLGFAAGNSDDINHLKNLLGPWAVSTPALRIGAAAIADRDFQDDQRQWIAKHYQSLLGMLENHGFMIIGGTGLYVLIEHDKAVDLHRHLGVAGIWTRVFEAQPKWLRIGLTDADGREKLQAALADWCQQSK